MHHLRPSTITLTLCQTDTVWCAEEENKKNIDASLQRPSHKTLYILPEMALSGFGNSTRGTAWDEIPSYANQWLTQLDNEESGILFSHWYREEETYKNRLFFGFQGVWKTYDKRYLFPLSKEAKYTRPGTGSVPVWGFHGWKVQPQICYDIRFPLETYNSVENRYDILVNLANWPKERIEAYHALLRARAIENQVISVGVNRVGTDLKDTRYSGESCVYDHMGNTLLALEKYKQQQQSLILEPSLWEKMRIDNVFFLDRKPISKD